MTKATSKLVAGDIMSSGEIVVSCEKLTPFGQGNPKAMVVLVNPSTGKRRICRWNWWGTVFLKNSSSESR